MAKNRDLYRRIRESLDATGTATVVISVRDGSYETDGRAYRAKGRDAREAVPAPPPSGTSVADQLRELKALYDLGPTTSEQYEAKRRQILDRM